MKHIFFILLALIYFSHAKSFSQSIEHTYEFTVVNSEGNPLANARIICQIKDTYGTEEEQTQTYKTDSSGKIVVRVQATLVVHETYKFAMTSIDYNVRMQGYCDGKGMIFCAYPSATIAGKSPIVSKRVILEPYSIIHQYHFFVHDINEKPIKKANVQLTIISGGISQDSSIQTSDTGDFSIAIPFVEDASSSYNSSIQYKISQDGYYTSSGECTSSFGGKYSSDQNPKLETINLIKDSDYLNPIFATSTQSSSLKKNIMKFIFLLRIQGILSDALLKYKSIDLINFKSKKYLQIKFLSTNTYNSLKLDKYDIGKTLFDEVVRKVLNPLNNFLNDTKIFYGYDVIVIGNTKDFSDKYAISQSLEYQFLMPESSVKSYKNKDISGQQLLDKSIILLDDERIDLKLQ